MSNGKKQDMVSVLFSLDDSICELVDIQNLFLILNEFLDGETEGIDQAPSSAGVFISRLPLMRSMLNVILYRLCDVVEDIQAAVSSGYEICRVDNGMHIRRDESPMPR